MVTDISRKLQQTEVSLLGGVPPSAHGDKVCCVKRVSMMAAPFLVCHSTMVTVSKADPTKLQEQSWPWIPLTLTPSHCVYAAEIPLPSLHIVTMDPTVFLS